MPGIFGFIDRKFPQGSEEILKRMASALDTGPVASVEFYQEGDFGIGRSNLGSINPEKQPLWNKERTVCIVMEGELYDSQALKNDLIDRGYQFLLNNDPELILNLYQEFGLDFVIRLNGNFILAIWEPLLHKLSIINDRLGLIPLYYSYEGGGLVFATGVRCLLVDPTLSRCVDHTAIAEFLTFDHVLHDRTLLQSVRLMPQGSVMTFVRDEFQIQRYYPIRFSNPYSLVDEFEYMEEYDRLLRQAIRRQVIGDHPSGLLLSGGLDSRLLLAYLCDETNKQTFHSFTWGIPGCDDARSAHELASKTCVQHKFFELKSNWLLENARTAVQLTDGMGNLVNLHALATTGDEAQLVKILYKGFLGDAMMGFALRPYFWANYDTPTGIQAHLKAHSEQGVLMYTPQEHKDIFSEEFLRALGTTVMEDYEAGMFDAGTDSLADQRVYFDYRQRVPRMTLRGVEVVRSKMDVRLPFADNDLVEFSLRLPPGLRYERRLQRNTFIRYFPELAQTPSPDTGLPMMMCARDVYLRGMQLIRWHLRARGFGRLAGPEKRPYKDYNLWFGTVLKNWVEETLLSSKSLNRGYLKPEFIQKIVKEHMTGTNHAVRLGALMSLELWHQIYLD
jgi:asparagine synthase (glutamine-hydrolysing)